MADDHASIVDTPPCAEMVTYPSPPDPPPPPQARAVPEPPTPTAAARAATVEHTGADPPPRPPWLRTYRQHRKVWLAWGRWWAIQVVWLPEVSFGVRLEPRRPLLDVFVGIATIAIGRHPVLTDPRTMHRHSGRGLLYPDDPILADGPVL